jgi:hypothetical protein
MARGGYVQMQSDWRLKIIGFFHFLFQHSPAYRGAVRWIAPPRQNAHLLLTRATPIRELIEQEPHAGQLVVWWVTTCEYWLLYLLFFRLSRLLKCPIGTSF